MTNKELLEVIAAEEAGKKIEFRVIGTPEWAVKAHIMWNTAHFDYRIAPMPPKKGGKWARKEIDLALDGVYRCCMKKIPKGSDPSIDMLQRIPGFGGIEYRSPWSAEHEPVINTQQVLFEEDGDWYTTIITGQIRIDDMRPGTPVAAWFWEEE